jgi:hypothetical protein
MIIPHMRILVFATLFLFCTGIRAQTSTLHDQLCLVNSAWEQYPNSQFSDQAAMTFDELSFIQFHLAQVELACRKNTPADLSETQLRNRMALLDSLNLYWQAGEFPNNTDHPASRAPYFIGQNGNVCAVGHLINASGKHELAQLIADSSNNAFIKEIDLELISSWQQESGFTLDELAWIQPGYPSQISQYEVVLKPKCGSQHQEGYSNPETPLPWYTGECKRGTLHGEW